ncbi:MAG: hypothetical protein JST85_18435 [Acidobacteria bacterium]|nr:hypothetical protein [Acidobacteriota bacterium]
MTKHIPNLFPIENLSGMQCEYHLLEVTNLPRNAQIVENLHRLAGMLAKDAGQPVSPYRVGDRHFLATTASIGKIKNEWRLTPHIAILKPVGQAEMLDYSDIKTEQVDLALNMLRFQIRGVLNKRAELWNDTSSTFYSRNPLPLGDAEEDVVVLPGFSYHLHYLSDGRICVSVESRVKYIDRRSLLEHLNAGADVADFRLQHFLYRSAYHWFRIQLMDLTGSSVAEQKFVHSQDGKTHNVYDWTINACRGHQPDHLKSLKPDSPAVVFRYPNDRKDMFGAAAICYKTYRSNAPQVRRLHHLSLLPPYKRLQKYQNLISGYLQEIHFPFGGHFSISDQPLTTRPRRFAIPDLLFGNGKVLHVKESNDDTGIPLQELGWKRMEYLQSSDGGLLIREPLPNQYLIAPTSLQRDVTKAFKSELVRQVRRMYPHQYQLTDVVFDDSNALNLHRQVQAIKRAIEKFGIDRGSALLILPENADADLHNYLKRELFEKLQTQCVDAAKLKTHFTSNGSGVNLRADAANKFISYTRNTAIGLMLVNRAWPFCLASPLNHDVHIGIDVLNGMAGFTYLYNGGKDTVFRPYVNTQGEKLSQKLVQKAVYDALKQDIQELKLSPRTLVFYRDGRSFAQEIEGMKVATQKLKYEEILASGTRFGVVEIHKSTTSNLRLFLERQNRIENPEIGDWFALNEKQGIVCNTGWPFQIPGTVNPLLLSIAYGDLKLEKILADAFALSLLAWTAPDKSSRVPIVNRLGDLFLRPLASNADDEAALYEDDELVESEAEAKAVNF